jgi:hypothetical protein
LVSTPSLTVGLPPLAAIPYTQLKPDLMKRDIFSAFACRPVVDGERRARRLTKVNVKSSCSACCVDQRTLTVTSLADRLSTVNRMPTSPFPARLRGKRTFA